MENKFKKLILQNFRWIGVDSFGIYLYRQKPRMVKGWHNKLGSLCSFDSFITDMDPVPLIEYNFEEVSDELKHNPRLYKVKIEITSIEKYDSRKNT